MSQAATQVSSNANGRTTQKPYAFELKGSPPTFMPRRPEIRVIGNAITVTDVRIRTLRFVCSATLLSISACSSRICSSRAELSRS